MVLVIVSYFDECSACCYSVIFILFWVSINIRTNFVTHAGNQTINVTGTNLGTSGDVYLGAVNLTVISRSDSLIELKTITPMPKGDAQKLRVLRGTEGALLDK